MLRIAQRSRPLIQAITLPSGTSATRFTSTMADKVVHIKSASEYNEHLKKSGLVVVDFSATWCGPCKMISPKFAEFSNKYTNATFLHIDVDEVQDHPDVQAVSGVPHFKFYKDGKVVTEFSGANPATLQKSIESNL